MNGKEEEIYDILYKKKEINDKTPKLRTEDEKKKLKNLSYKISKIPKNLIDNIITKFPSLQRKPQTAEERKEQKRIIEHKKRSKESEIERQRRLNKQKEYNEKYSFCLFSLLCLSCLSWRVVPWLAVVPPSWRS